MKFFTIVPPPWLLLIIRQNQPVIVKYRLVFTKMSRIFLVIWHNFYTFTSRFQKRIQADPIKKTKCAPTINRENKMLIPWKGGGPWKLYWVKSVFAKRRIFPHWFSKRDMIGTSDFAAYKTKNEVTRATRLFLNKLEHIKAKLAIMITSTHWDPMTANVCWNNCPVLSSKSVPKKIRPNRKAKT